MDIYIFVPTIQLQNYLHDEIHHRALGNISFLRGSTIGLKSGETIRFRCTAYNAHGTRCDIALVHHSISEECIRGIVHPSLKNKSSIVKRFYI